MLYNQTHYLVGYSTLTTLAYSCCKLRTYIRFLSDWAQDRDSCSSVVTNCPNTKGLPQMWGFLCKNWAIPGKIRIIWSLYQVTSWESIFRRNQQGKQEQGKKAKQESSLSWKIVPTCPWGNSEAQIVWFHLKVRRPISITYVSQSFASDCSQKVEDMLFPACGRSP